ncbi:MAG: hypothetical protein JWL85_255 [Candidatus Saccharibacteria bacterium]|nr:hypothetical protein [Candidatus Saccharibacteria bacterium]
MHDFKQQSGRDVELISLETRDGAATATLYDVVQYPAVIAMKDNGELVTFWQGGELPLMNEVAAYLA